MLILYVPQCHFMSMIWFRALKDYEYAMRVDEDVCITRLPSHSVFKALTSVYAFGLETDESHVETVQTFGPWMRDYIATKGQRPDDSRPIE
eukprot:1947020-Prymnesium_polylepis.1